MKYDFLDHPKFKDIPVLNIANNKNGLPFSILRLHNCARKKHRHQYIQINYIKKGRLQHIIYDHVYNVEKGDVFVIPPMVPHYFNDETTEPYEIIEFEFSPDFIHERFSLDDMNPSFFDFAYLEPFLVHESQSKPRLRLSGHAQREAERLFEEILLESSTLENGYKRMVKALTLQLLVLLGRMYDRSMTNMQEATCLRRHRDALLHVIEYIENQYDTDISIDEAAKMAMMSRSYFCYLFKQLTSKTLMEYIHEKRITKAVSLLMQDKEARITDIGYRVGYNNMTHFYRKFRQFLGTSPTDYRNNG